MPTLLSPPSPIETIADLLDRLGGVPADRVRFYPYPGTATEQDVINIEAHEDRLFELVDGTLVEKPMGFEESLLAVEIATFLRNFVRQRKAGWVTGEAGMMRVVRSQVRMPDVAFVSRDTVADGKRPRGPVAALSPDLAVEVLSKSNTVAEIDRKRREYFEGGTRLVWIVDPKARTIAVYTAPDSPDAVLAGAAVLDGGDVLPGFTLDLPSLFACLDE